jgi:membrane-associated phospholipid phosphatase
VAAELACEAMGAKDQVAVVPNAGRRSRQRANGPVAPLLPAGARRPAAIVAVCGLVLVVVLGGLFAHQTHGAAIDQAVDSWVLGLGIPSGPLELISRLGSVPAMTVMTALLALGCLLVRRLNGALLAIIGVLLASGLTEFVLKPLVHRIIGISSLTYPSGHTTGLFALSTVLAVVLLSPTSGRPRPAVRIAVVVVAVIVSCAVGLSMIGLIFHYFTDTIAGAAVGIFAVLITAFVLDLEAVRRQLGRPTR